MDWTNVDLSGDPRMLLGRRTSAKRVDLHRVEVDAGLFEDLRLIAASALEELARRDAKTYSEFGHATSDDYFEIEVSELPMRRDGRKREDDPKAFRPASALDMTVNADSYPTLDAEELRDFKADLYVLAFEDGADGYVCFVRKRSPQRPIKPGLRFLQYGDTLRKVEAPDLMIDDEVDIVLTTERGAILDLGAFRTIFGDVRVAFESVPANTAAIQQALDRVIPLGEDAVEALQARCGRRLTDARRLHRLIEEKAADIESLTPVALEDLLVRRGLDVLRDGQIELDDEAAADFLDLLDGRFFDDDITSAPRRADAFSPR
jgi:hypothetical protein